VGTRIDLSHLVQVSALRISPSPPSIHDLPSSILYLLSSILDSFAPFEPGPMGRKRAGQPRAVRHTIAGRFGRRLEQLATAAGLTTAEFARKVGVTEDAIRKYYRGSDICLQAADRIQ